MLRDLTPAFGDAIGGELFILKTTDGGNNWQRIAPEILPEPLGSEGGFAASGTCIAIGENGFAWIGTGAGKHPRVLISKDYGRTWRHVTAPLIAGKAAGIASIKFWDNKAGFIGGSDLALNAEFTGNTAITMDEGLSWKLTNHPTFTGAIYGSATTRIGDTKYLIVSGPNGLDFSVDLGENRNALDSANYWAVDFSESGTGWAVGKGGRVAKISFN